MIAVTDLPIRQSMFRRRVERLLAAVDVHLDGSRPWDIRIHNERFFRRVMAHGDLGFGESHMDGDWSTARPLGINVFSKHVRAGARFDDPRDPTWG
jgi:hypothetical protein